MNIEFLKGPEGDHQYRSARFHRKGGMGEIYLAEDSARACQVAVKVIPIDRAGDASLIKSEASIALSLQHAKIVETYFAAEVELYGAHYFYYTMEYLRNGSLREFLSSRTNLLPLEEALQFMIDIAEGLEYAHTKIVHRDLKPENILLDDLGKPKICDFGLAKLVDSQTRTHSFKGAGTLAYMAPEAWEGNSNTPAMDQYSAGIMFSELLTLRRPFEGPTEKDFRQQHLYQRLPNLVDIRKDVPVKLAEVLSKMADKHSAARYPSMTEVKAVLMAILTDSNSASPTLAVNDFLLIKAKQRVEVTKQEELEAKRLRDEKEHQRRLLNFSKDSVISLYTKRAKDINDGLAQDKIRIDQGLSYLHLYFQKKSVSVVFFDENRVDLYVASRREAALKHHQAKFGMPLINPTPFAVERDNIVWAAQTFESGGDTTQRKWGFNLVLRRGKGDIYGKWWVTWFDDDALATPYGPLALHYALPEGSFYDAFERSRPYHVPLRELTETDVDSLLERLFM